MRICPKCHTKYTDLTLKFCLQDGAELLQGADDKTEVIDSGSFSDDPTVAHISAEAAGRSGQAMPDSGPSIKTFVRDREGLYKPRVGFVSGVVAGALILGLLAAISLALWFLPRMLQAEPNAIVNVQKPETYRVTADSAKSVEASSVRKSEKGNLYIAENIFDSDIRTAWCEGVRGAGKGEWIKIDFGKKLKISSLELKPGYFKNASIWKKNNRVSSVQLQFSNGQFRIFDLPDEMKTQHIALDGIETTFVKMTIRDIHAGSSDREDTPVSEIAFVAEK